VDAFSPPLAASHAFITMPLDRCDDLRNQPQTLAALWPQAQVLVLDSQGNALSQINGLPWLLCGAAWHQAPPSALFLGKWEETAWFAVNTIPDTLKQPRQWVGLRQAGMEWPSDVAAIFSYARSMLYWQSRNRFCGACGHTLILHHAGFAAHCDQCGAEYYPRVNPAVIMAVSNQQRLLLGRQQAWQPGRWSVLAGFVEPGETLEQAVVREVFEETRVRVIHAYYGGSQPWSFPAALMLGFYAQAENDTPVVNGELEAARWYSAEEINAAIQREAANTLSGITLPPPLSIARTLIEQWLLTYK